MAERFLRVISGKKTQSGIAGNATLQTATPTIPEGYRAVGAEVLVEVTPTGSSGTGTSKASAVIKSVSMQDEFGKTRLNTNSGLAFALLAAKSSLDYADSSAVPSTSPAAWDQDVALAGNALVLSMYRFRARFKGTSFSLTANFFLPTLAGYSTQPTSYTAGITLVILCLPSYTQSGVFEALSGQDLGTNTQFTFRDAALGNACDEVTLMSTSQLDSNITSWQHGARSYAAGDIAALEQATAQDATITGVAASGLTLFAATSRQAAAGIVSVASASIGLYLLGRVPQTI